MNPFNFLEQMVYRTALLLLVYSYQSSKLSFRKSDFETLESLLAMSIMAKLSNFCLLLVVGCGKALFVNKQNHTSFASMQLKRFNFLTVGLKNF